MSVSNEEIKKIAKLAKLNISEKETEEFTGDMNRILEYVDKLNRLDTRKVKPLLHPFEESNVLREDELLKMLEREEALKNAPKRTEEFFKVPKVIKSDKK